MLAIEQCQKANSQAATTDEKSLVSTFLKSSLLSRLTLRSRQPQNRQVLQNQAGQILVEYILLLFISVSIATFLTSKLINRNADNPGVVTGAWGQINQAIGEDIID